MQGRIKKIYKSIIFAFIPLFVVFVIAESTLRLTGKSWVAFQSGWGMKYHPTLGWDLKCFNRAS